jgi:hypothetical protein
MLQIQAMYTLTCLAGDVSKIGRFFSRVSYVVQEIKFQPKLLGYHAGHRRDAPNGAHVEV